MFSITWLKYWYKQSIQDLQFGYDRETINWLTSQAFPGSWKTWITGPTLQNFVLLVKNQQLTLDLQYNIH